MDIHQTITETNIFTIFIFILIISGNFLAQLFPCRLQADLNDKMYLKHLFGFFTMIFFVVLAAPVKDKTISVVVLNSFLLYLLFILITKVHVKVFYAIMTLLGGTYIAVLLKQTDLDKVDASANAIISIKSGEIENKPSIIDDSSKYLKVYDTIISYSYIIILLLTIVGVLAYMGEKKIEYKNKFTYATFFLGKTICKHNSPSVGIFEALKHSV